MTGSGRASDRRRLSARVWSVLTWRPVVFLLVVATLAAVFNLYLSLAAPAKIDDALAQASQLESSLAVEVELGSPPEEFHLQELQVYGTVSSVEGSVVNLIRVDGGDVPKIARKYWVQGLRQGEQ